MLGLVDPGIEQRLGDGNATGAMHTARRIAKILKTIVGQLDVLETMTPQQFAAFRPELGSASGFQSDQFRVLEAVLGRRDFDPGVVAANPALAAALARPSVFDSLVAFLARSGFAVPPAALDRDPHEAKATIVQRGFYQLRYLGRQARFTYEPVPQGAVVANVHDLKLSGWLLDPPRQ